MPTTKKTWIAFAWLAALVIAAVSWLVVISPVRAETSDLKDQAQAVEDSNAVLKAKVDRLQKQFEGIADLRKELRGYETRIPRDVDYQSISDEIQRAVEKSEVTLLGVSNEDQIVQVSPFTALKVEKPEATDPDAPVATSTSGGTSSAVKAPETVTGAAPTKTGALSEVVDGFYQIPLSIRVHGNYQEVSNFAKELQVNSTRAILASSVTITAQNEGGESQDYPKSEAGDMEFEVRALAYVLDYDTSVLGDQEIDAAPEKKMPKPATSNVFAPSFEDK